MTDTTISIIGCGWLGFPLGKQLFAEGAIVKGSTTSTSKLPILNQAGIEPYQLQLNPEADGDLTLLLEADTVLIDIPPKAGKLGDDFHPQQIQTLTEAIRKSPAKHVIYVSSTSIYPELNRVVTEDDVVTADQSAAAGLVQAEQLVLSLATERTVTILRCGGLLGYDRIPGKYVAGRAVSTGAIPVNYLHRDDAVGILRAIIRQKPAGTFNAISPEHPTREAVYRKNCADFGFDLPTFNLPEAPMPYKVVSPEKLLRVTSYSFKYADPLQFFYEL